MRRLLLALLVVGCTPDFQNVTTVEDLRVLGVVADPPEILIEGGPVSTSSPLCPTQETLTALIMELATHLPDKLPPVTLRPIVADPRGAGRPVHYRAVACVSPSGTLDPDMGGGGMAPGGVRQTVGRGACPDDAPVLAEGDASAPDGGLVPIQFDFAPTPELLASALRADLLGAVYGLPLTVQITVSAGSEQVIARKRVLVDTKLTADQQPNSNPTIPGIGYRHTETEETLTPFDFANPSTNPPQVHLGEKLRIQPTAGSKDMYPTRIGDRSSGCTSIHMETEALRFAFFATAGKFSPEATNTEPPVFRSPAPDVHRLESVYEAPKELAPGQSDLVRVWVVTRDERAGSSFVEVALKLVP